MRFVAMLWFLAALFGALMAYAHYWGLCLSNENGPCTPGGGGPRWELVAQLVIGLAGVIPAGLMLLLCWRGRLTAAARWFWVAVAFYVAWAFTADAAVHGWDNLRLLGN